MVQVSCHTAIGPPVDLMTDMYKDVPLYSVAMRVNYITMLVDVLLEPSLQDNYLVMCEGHGGTFLGDKL